MESIPADFLVCQVKAVVGLTLIPTVVFTAAFLSVLWEFGYQVSKPGGGGGSWIPG